MRIRIQLAGLQRHVKHGFISRLVPEIAAPKGQIRVPGLDRNAHSQIVYLVGIPQLGKPGDWESRLLNGRESLYQNALNGYIGDGGMLMPAKGGHQELSDEQVNLIVDYMLDKAGFGK